MADQRRRFVGIGVGVYDDDAYEPLPKAVAEIEDIASVLARNYAGKPLINPNKQQVTQYVEEAIGALPRGGAIVVYWTGHGKASPVGGLRLLTADSGSNATAGVPISEVVGPCAESGANQLLIVVDTCFSGGGVDIATQVASAVMTLRPPNAEDLWCGVLASCAGEETAYDGALGSGLRHLLSEGPTTAELQVRGWSPHDEFVRGDDLCDALLKEWDSDHQHPVFRSGGSALRMLPNPLYDPGAPDEVVEHLLQAARGGTSDDGRSWFTGREAELQCISDWVRKRRPGVHVVTGPPGTGKSALVGRVVSLSNPIERGRLRRSGVDIEANTDPGERSVHAHAHARRLSADRLAGFLDRQLVQAGFWQESNEGPRNTLELLGIANKRLDDAQRRPVIVIDGLDEARSEAFSIARKLIVPLAETSTVVVATRDVPGSALSLIQTLQPVVSPLDLNDEQSRERRIDDIHEYVLRRLADVSKEMDAAAVAEVFTGRSILSGRTSSTVDRPFLLARLVTEQLRSEPIDTGNERWQREVSVSIEAAFETDVRKVERAHPAPSSLRGSGRALLAALTWANGAGFPEEEWLTVAGVGAGSDVPSRADVDWALDWLGRYIVQDGENGQAVYRVVHQSLADYLRPPYRPSPRAPFDPAAAEIVAALIARVTRLIHQNLLLFGSPYLTRYMWQHSASWGPAGVRALAEAVGTRPEFRDDVSAAAVEVAEIAHRLRRPDLTDAVKDWLAEPWQTSDDTSAPVDDSLPRSEYQVGDAGLVGISLGPGQAYPRPRSLFKSRICAMHPGRFQLPT